MLFLECTFLFFLFPAEPRSSLKNQARGRTMSEQAPLVIGEPPFRGANPLTTMQHHSLCLDQTGFWRDGPHEGNLELDRRLPKSLFQG